MVTALSYGPLECDAYVWTSKVYVCFQHGDEVIGCAILCESRLLSFRPCTLASRMFINPPRFAKELTFGTLRRVHALATSLLRLSQRPTQTTIWRVTTISVWPLMTTVMTMTTAAPGWRASTTITLPTIVRCSVFFCIFYYIGAYNIAWSSVAVSVLRLFCFCGVG